MTGLKEMIIIISKPERNIREKKWKLFLKESNENSKSKNYSI